MPAKEPFARCIITARMLGADCLLSLAWFLTLVLAIEKPIPHPTKSQKNRHVT